MAEEPALRAASHREPEAASGSGKSGGAADRCPQSSRESPDRDMVPGSVSSRKDAAAGPAASAFPPVAGNAQSPSEAPPPAHASPDPAPSPRRRGRTWAGAGAGIALVVFLWWLAVTVLEPPRYVFPSPVEVARVLLADWDMLLRNAAITGAEMVIGLAVGTIAGIMTALAVAATPLVRRLVLPAVIVTQTLPVFAIAPLLVVWLGYGLASKIVMAALIIYFPVATAYAEAMMRVDRRLVDLARLQGAGRLSILWLIRAPGGLPGLVAGLKVAATVAPIGAVVGEWVGASAGLGYVMLHANARLQTDTLFAALFLLAVLALVLRRAVDLVADRLVPWQPAD